MTIGDIYNLELPENFYGGTVDFVSGVATQLYDENGNELATPIIYNLTPQQVSLNSGTNNVWSDAGYICVEYMKDKGELTDTLAELQHCCQGALIVPMARELSFHTGNYMEIPYDTIYNAYAEGRQVYFKDPQGNFYTASYIGKRDTYDVIDLLYFTIDSYGDYYERFTFAKEDGYPKYIVVQ